MSETKQSSPLDFNQYVKLPGPQFHLRGGSSVLVQCILHSYGANNRARTLKGSVVDRSRILAVHRPDLFPPNTRVNTPHHGAGKVLAIDEGMAWVKLDCGGYQVLPMEKLIHTKEPLPC